MYVHVCVGVHSAVTCGAQRTVCRCCFSLSGIWVLGIGLRLSGLHSKLPFHSLKLSYRGYNNTRQKFLPHSIQFTYSPRHRSGIMGWKWVFYLRVDPTVGWGSSSLGGPAGWMRHEAVGGCSQLLVPGPGQETSAISAKPAWCPVPYLQGPETGGQSLSHPQCP